MTETNSLPTNLQNQRYISDRTVSELTGIAVQTLRNHRFNGRGLPYVKVGRMIRYRLADVISFMESGRVIPGEAVR